MTFRHLLFLVLSIMVCAFGARNACAQSGDTILGYSAKSASAEIELERKLSATIVPSRLDTLVRQLSMFNRIAGSPDDRKSCDFVERTMRAAGLNVKEYPYTVYLPYPKSVSLEMTAPHRKAYTLHEKKYPEEKNIPINEYPWVNGYAGNGSVSGEVVYVNYGLSDDYRLLDSMGISVAGKIVLARYGRSYRGAKAEQAERHGASGLILFTDPSGDGYTTGDMFPEGPARPNDGIQRGSVYNGHGDPSSPMHPWKEGMPRLPLTAMKGIVSIPVIPVSADIALDLLRSIKGKNIPEQSWQGGLPLRYHAGPGPASVRLTVQTDRGYRTIWNTIATVGGSEFPNEWIIVGGHRDAWGPGAEDNGAGCTAVMAAAEAVAKMAKDGVQPKRSILFASWDAEEWGLIGSTEWAKEMNTEITGKAVAYINEDECATGDHFGVGADPLMRSFLWQVYKNVEIPGGTNVFELWMKQQPSPSTKTPAPSKEPGIGLLGGGSDFSSFYGHLGIPAIEQNFNGAFGQYHSIHDNYYYVKHFGDTSFVYHAAVARITATEAIRLANATADPYDFSELSKSILEFSHGIKHDLPATWEFNDQFAALDTSLAKMKDKASMLNTLIQNQLERGMTAASSETLNKHLREILFLFSPESGLESDPWVHNTIVCTDPANGYADMTLPELHLALRRGDRDQFATTLSAFTKRIDQVSEKMDEVIGTLR